MRLSGDMQVEAQRPPFRARGPGAGNKAAATAGTCLVGAGGGKGADTRAALKKPGREGASGSGAAGGNGGGGPWEEHDASAGKRPGPDHSHSSPLTLPSGLLTR